MCRKTHSTAHHLRRTTIIQVGGEGRSGEEWGKKKNGKSQVVSKDDRFKMSRFH